jgi:glycosyltransferase involved in cell wall biosynthesis
VFVTQNGDWPARAGNSEYRFFGCDGLICTNPEFYERNRNRWRSTLIPNGIDYERFHPGAPRRQEFGLPLDRLIILMVSALISSKGVELGVEAVSRIPDAYLIVAGDGPLRRSIDALAARLLPDRFKRLSLALEQMPALYRSADVFLHLSKDEAFGNVFVEAMACGLPVVAYDSPRSRWIVGEDEFLLESSDIGAIARNLELARSVPSSQRQVRARKSAAFSWSRIGGMYRDFLKEVVGQTARY